MGSDAERCLVLGQVATQALKVLQLCGHTILIRQRIKLWATDFLVSHSVGMMASRRSQNAVAAKAGGSTAGFWRAVRRSEPARHHLEANAMMLCRSRPERSGWPRKGSCSGTLRSSTAGQSLCCGCCCQQTPTPGPRKTPGCALTSPKAGCRKQDLERSCAVALRGSGLLQAGTQCCSRKIGQGRHDPTMAGEGQQRLHVTAERTPA